MNKSIRILCATLLATASVAAFAQTADETAARDQANSTAHNNYPVTIFHSTETRAQVKAEQAAGQQQGAQPSTNSNAVAPSGQIDNSLYSGA